MNVNTYLPISLTFTGLVLAVYLLFPAHKERMDLSVDVIQSAQLDAELVLPATANEMSPLTAIVITLDENIIQMDVDKQEEQQYPIEDNARPTPGGGDW